MKKALVSLLPHESKRLIAKGVKEKLKKKGIINRGKILITLGTSNIYVAEEITGKVLKDKKKFVAGLISEGVHCLNPKENRLPSILIDENGRVQHVEDIFQSIENFGAGDVYIKGANALDSDYNIGIYMANEMGGKISAYPLLQARGVEIITPVGREKLIPSVPMVAGKLGIEKIDYSTGKPCGMICIPTASVVTEVEAFQLLTEVDSYHVAAGGVDGSEGACGFLLEGTEQEVKEAVSLVKKIKKNEKPFKIEKMSCGKCDKPCFINKEV